MSLKRKRSCDTISQSSASTSSVSSSNSSPTAFPHTFHITTGAVDAFFPSHRKEFASPSPSYPGHSSSDLHSRTMKRFRNNRPAESDVFASTYERLFSAARKTYPNSQPSQTPHQQSIHTVSSAPRQSSLHNFWTLPLPPTSTVTAIGDPSISNGPDRERCEDCDAPLPSSSIGDINMGGMEMDLGCTALDEDPRCTQCKRLVCVTCAVVETGVGRECLECRMR